MRMYIFGTPEQLGVNAARQAAALLNDAIRANGRARMILSTGASQFDTLKALRAADVDWTKVEMFHLDEYVGIDPTHPAGFVKYLKERFVLGDLPLKAAYFIDGQADPHETMAMLTQKLREAPVDVALIGIGENAHIAFNDPPADFDTDEAFKVVTLDEACKRQQVREGWFPTIDDVPRHAISMTVRQILHSKTIISAVPYCQKAEAVSRTLANEPTNMIPATALKNHSDWHLYLDKESSSKIETGR